jgi:hypothetical protein
VTGLPGNAGDVSPDSRPAATAPARATALVPAVLVPAVLVPAVLVPAVLVPAVLVPAAGTMWPATLASFSQVSVNSRSGRDALTMPAPACSHACPAAW